MTKEFIEPHWEDFPNFGRSEVACQHCGRAEMDEDFMWRLQDLREAYGKPMKITSGYRCPDYNSLISSTGRTGPHTTGRAVDISVSRKGAWELLRLICSIGKFTGIGIKQHGGGRFVHIDTLPPNHDDDQPLRPAVWSYA